MTVKAVIFDLDGTIAGFNLDYMTVRAEVRSYLIRMGVPASVLASNESIFDMLKKTEIFFKNTGKSKRAFTEVKNKSLSIAEKFELEAAKTTGLLPGVITTLESLKKMNVKIGLCTINSEKSVQYILKRFGILRYFDAVTSRNKVRYVKPNIEHLAAALKALRISPKESVFVGDSVRDMACAKELESIAVGLPTGVSSEKDLINSGADYLVTSIADMPRLVQTINESSRSRSKSIKRSS